MNFDEKIAASRVTETDIQRNEIVKELGRLLPKIDPRVSWAEYIPKSAGLPFPVIVICIENKLKFVEILPESHFKMTKRIINAMDDYCFDVQFLTDSKSAFIKEAFAGILKRNMSLSSWITNWIRSGDIEDSVVKQIEKIMSSGIESYVDLQVCAGLIRDALERKQTEMEDSYEV